MKTLDSSPLSAAKRQMARLFGRLTAVSIRTKILGMVAGVVLLLGFAVTLMVRVQLQSELSASLEARGVAIAADLSARSADLILTENTFGLYQLIRDTLENNPDIRYAFVLDSQGQVLVHSFGQGVPPDLLTVNPVDGQQPYRVQVLDSDEGLITDVAVPILDGRAGVARVGLSQRRLAVSVLKSTWNLIGVTALALTLGLGLALILTRVLTRPVLELVEVARAVGLGDLSVKARKYMDDEIGELSAAFNRMTDSLASSRAELLRRVRELSVLTATAIAISADQSLPVVLQTALEKILQVMGLQAGWIFLVDENSTNGQDSIQLTMVVQSGLSPAFAAEEAQCKLSGCVCEQVLQNGQASIVRNIRCECPCLSPAVIEAEGLVCHASVPLVARDRVIGVMNVASSNSREFSPEELALLDSVGRQICVAVENARLWEEVHRRDILRGQLLSQVINAQEAERKRISRELHDETGQLLTALMVGLRTLEQIPAVSATAAQDVANLKELAKQIYDEIHRLAVELRPKALDQLGLVRAMESYVREFGQRVGVKVRFEASGLDGAQLPSEVETALYRLIQEALSNIAKHASAEHAEILLERRGQSLVAVIEDDGCGFDVEAALRPVAGERPHLGLFGMQERAALLGGRLTIESSPEQGTTIFVEIPLGEWQESVRES